MGQYYIVVNLDKEQYLYPHEFGDGLKLLEFGASAEGTMMGLAILLADGNNRGGGDLHSDDSIIGSWAGDRIVIAGDYADGRKFIPPYVQDHELAELATKVFSEGYQDKDEVTIHNWARHKFENISAKVIEAMGGKT